jgi:hypothetical protein
MSSSRRLKFSLEIKEKPNFKIKLELNTRLNLILKKKPIFLTDLSFCRYETQKYDDFEGSKRIANKVNGIE